MAVFVLDIHGKALMPCTEKRARLLLERGRARLHRLLPMVIRLVDRQAEDCKYWDRPPLALKATGRGSYQRTRLDKFGFPRAYLMRSKRVHGFATGDMVRADVPKGLKAGVHWGRVAVRATGNFNIQSHQAGVSAVVQGIHYRHCRVVQRNDGYGYFLNPAIYTGREQVRPKASDAAHPARYLPGMNAEVSRAL